MLSYGTSYEVWHYEWWNRSDLRGSCRYILYVKCAIMWLGGLSKIREDSLPATTVSACDSLANTCSMRPTSVQACRLRTLFRRIAMNTLHISACNTKNIMPIKQLPPSSTTQLTISHLNRYLSLLYKWYCVKWTDVFPPTTHSVNWADISACNTNNPVTNNEQVSQPAT
jgi:hypothetical protein